MTHLVTENCIKCKHTDCVDVCPVDCFYEGPNIDCAVCIPECPVEAIVPDNVDNIDVIHWTDLYRRLSKKWPNITQKKPALPDAELWNGKPDKINLLEE